MRMVVSSSCTAYGKPNYTPSDEKHALQAVSPCGRSKLIIEDMFRDLAASPEGKEWKIILLRYFNPVGAHPSGKQYPLVCCSLWCRLQIWDCGCIPLSMQQQLTVRHLGCKWGMLLPLSMHPSTERSSVLEDLQGCMCHLVLCLKVVEALPTSQQPQLDGALSPLSAPVECC